MTVTMKRPLLALSALFFLSNIPNVSAAKFSQTPQEVIDQCYEQIPPPVGNGIADALKFEETYTLCVQKEINRRIITIKGQQEGEKITQMIDDLLRPIIDFYDVITEGNKYCDLCGNMALYANLVGLEQYINALLFRISDLPANYSDHYTKEVDKKSSVISKCKHQESCIIEHIQIEMKKGFNKYYLTDGEQLFRLIHENTKNIYNNIYPDKPDKAAAALVEDLEYFLRRLLYLNLTKEGY